MARHLLFDSVKRKGLVGCVPVKIRADGKCDQKVFDEFITNYSVILRAISSRRKINADCLEQLCKETSLTLVSYWPTFKFTPAVHQVLAHSAALITAFESTGLGSLSEEPLEHNNKNIRNYREHLSRKMTQHANLSDVLTRLWVKSDPIIRSARNKTKCSFCSNEHNVRSCPQKQVQESLCLSFEENLISCIFADEETPTALDEQI